jgi:hypothetical protein
MLALSQDRVPRFRSTLAVLFGHAPKSTWGNQIDMGYHGDMRPEDLRAYARRDWNRLAALKRARWRQRRKQLGAKEGFRLAGVLYEHVRCARPDWPSRASRRSDLDHHIALSERLRALRIKAPH